MVVSELKSIALHIPSGYMGESKREYTVSKLEHCPQGTLECIPTPVDEPPRAGGSDVGKRNDVQSIPNLPFNTTQSVVASVVREPRRSAALTSINGGRRRSRALRCHTWLTSGVLPRLALPSCHMAANTLARSRVDTLGIVDELEAHDAVRICHEIGYTMNDS